MIRFIDTYLKLQSIITVYILNSFWTTFAWGMPVKSRTDLSLLSDSHCFDWMNQLSLITDSESNTDHCLKGFYYYSTWIPYPGILCLETCYQATTRSLLFVVTGTWFPIRCSAMDLCSAPTIPAFSRHVTLFYWYTCMIPTSIITIFGSEIWIFNQGVPEIKDITLAFWSNWAPTVKNLLPLRPDTLLGYASTWRSCTPQRIRT
jgi:hypothetical protein